MNTLYLRNCPRLKSLIQKKLGFPTLSAWIVLSISQVAYSEPGILSNPAINSHSETHQTENRSELTLLGTDYIEHFDHVEIALQEELRTKSMGEAFSRYILRRAKPPEYDSNQEKLKSVRKVRDLFRQSQLMEVSFSRFWQSISNKDSAFYEFQEDVIEAQKARYPTPDIMKRLTEKAIRVVSEKEEQVREELRSTERLLSPFHNSIFSSKSRFSNQEDLPEKRSELKKKLAQARLTSANLQRTKDQDIENLIHSSIHSRELESFLSVHEIAIILNRINARLPEEITHALIKSDHPYFELVRLFSKPGRPLPNPYADPKRETYFYSAAEEIIDQVEEVSGSGRI